MLPRNLTEEEKAVALLIWPNMHVDTVLVTAEETPKYNCLAWTLGITTSWIWPPVTGDATKSDFDELYKSYGFDPGSSGDIAAWGISLKDMTHGSIYSTPYKKWESKCGGWLRIIHTLPEMSGGQLYGTVQYYYSKQGALQQKAEKMSKDFNKENALSAQEQEGLKKAISTIDSSVKNNFYEKYEKWKATWQHPLIAISSNPADRANSIEFLELVSMGNAIIPLLIEKLQYPDEFFALQAVDQLQDQSLLVKREFGDEAILLGEQGRALETIKRWARYYL